MKYKIVKQHSDASTSTSESDTSEYKSTSTIKEPSRKVFIPIDAAAEEDDYVKPKKGTVQDNYTKEEINNLLKGYVSLKNSSQKKYLLTLQPFKVWVKYYNPTTKKFRTGGLLMKVDPDLRFITLGNPSQKINWSVQLKDHVIFVPNPQKKEEEIKEQKEQIREENMKDKLLNLYKQGKLQKKAK
jgi:hypothetical protein